MDKLKKINWNAVILYILWMTFLLGAITVYVNTARIRYFVSNPAREYQTIGITKYFDESGIHLFSPKTTLAFNSEYLAIEFPLFQVIGAIVSSITGLTEPMIKMLSVTFLFFSVLLIYKISRCLNSSKKFAIFASSIYLVLPCNLLYQPTGLIDPFALFLSILTLYFGIKWIFVNQSPSKTYFIFFLVSGILGIITKFTPLIIQIPILFITIIYKHRTTPKLKRYLFQLFLSVLVWFITLLAWYFWSNYLNSQTTISAYTWGNIQNNFMVSSFLEFKSLLSQNFSTLLLMFIDQSNSNSVSKILIILFLIVLIYGCFLLYKKNRFVFLVSILWIAGFFVELVLFSKAFLTHAYYWLPLNFGIIFPLASFFEEGNIFVSQIFDDIKTKYNFSYLFEKSVFYIIYISILFFSTQIITPYIFKSETLSISGLEQKYYIIVAIAIVIMICISFLSIILIKIKFENFIVGISLIILLFLLPQNSLRFFQKFWNNSYNLWTLSQEYIDNAHFIANHLPEDKKAVIVVSQIYQPHLQYISQINGYLVLNEVDADLNRYYESVNNPIENCFSQSGFPMEFQEPCIMYFKSKNIVDVFYISEKNNPKYTQTVLQINAKKYGLIFVDQFRSDNNKITNVFHYKIP